MKGIVEKLLGMDTYAKELGINLDTEEGRFKWFLASLLFAKRISSEIAKKTYHQFEKSGIVDPESIIQAGWDRLVEVLDSGGYVRYDFSTASNLLEIASSLGDKYGSLDNLYAQSKDSKDLEKRLLEFKGIGPTTVNIFLRELKGVWEKARPRLSPQAKEAASRLGIGEKEMELPNIESVLVRLNLEFCKPRRCSSCPVREECQEAEAA
jgi:endonuclease III